MTIQQLQQGGDPIVLAALQRQMSDATEQADNLAHVAANARIAAAEQQQIADQAEREGLAMREAAERFRRHLDMERSVPGDVPGETVTDEGDVQTVLFARPSFNRPPYGDEWPRPAA